jgi:hypothetical protein
VLMWQPGKEPGVVLEGVPEDARFKYPQYD